MSIKDTNVYVVIANTGEFDVRYNKTKSDNTLIKLKQSALKNMVKDPIGAPSLYKWVAKNLANNLDQIAFPVVDGDYDSTKQELIEVMTSLGYTYRHIS
jgi:hypothetical protein